MTEAEETSRYPITDDIREAMALIRRGGFDDVTLVTQPEEK